MVSLVLALWYKTSEVFVHEEMSEGVDLECLRQFGEVDFFEGTFGVKLLRNPQYIHDFPGSRAFR